MNLLSRLTNTNAINAYLIFKHQQYRTTNDKIEKGNN